MAIFISLTRARSMKDSVMVGMSGLQVMAKGHLLTWNTKSFEPSLVVWLSGVFILFQVGEILKMGQLSLLSLQYSGSAAFWVSRHFISRKFLRYQYDGISFATRKLLSPKTFFFVDGERRCCSVPPR